HKVLEQAYSPMTIRFFILQAHYRSTLDFSNEALQAARKGYVKLMNGLHVLSQLEYPAEAGQPDEKLESDISKLIESCFRSLNDDLNTAKAIAGLFNLLKKINSMFLGHINVGSISRNTFDNMKQSYVTLVQDVLGLKDEKAGNLEQMLQLVLQLYKEAKAAKDYVKVDEIRAGLKQQGIVIKDLKTGVDWAYEE
ncbi:MAG: cysteine--tRNA ligase, partial [Hymenobacteraceae bacterium]|nr:cysteine--tRNA ligase [Hymenobacteraceae bacterium]MDX5394572.1 cysteine--tRNA ligase [Hymenobacteraceae bacterium]MDX5510593.1 cysteine--tRNA ligase [Hymenobacteraceae bacterium]